MQSSGFFFAKSTASGAHGHGAMIVEEVSALFGSVSKSDIARFAPLNEPKSSALIIMYFDIYFAPPFDLFLAAISATICCCFFSVML